MEPVFPNGSDVFFQVKKHDAAVFFHKKYGAVTLR